jgi:hypothetical protein
MHTDIDAALVKEQGQAFAVVVIKSSVKNGGERALQEAAQSFCPAFPGVPIVLMWQDNQGIPTYWGRHDIVDFLKVLNPAQIPWRRWSVDV